MLVTVHFRSFASSDVNRKLPKTIPIHIHCFTEKQISFEPVISEKFCLNKKSYKVMEINKENHLDRMIK